MCYIQENDLRVFIFTYIACCRVKLTLSLSHKLSRNAWNIAHHSTDSDSQTQERCSPRRVWSRLARAEPNLWILRHLVSTARWTFPPLTHPSNRSSTSLFRDVEGVPHVSQRDTEMKATFWIGKKYEICSYHCLWCIITKRVPFLWSDLAWFFRKLSSAELSISTNLAWRVLQ